jgi:hypothetical protein
MRRVHTPSPQTNVYSKTLKLDLESKIYYFSRYRNRLRVTWSKNQNSVSGKGINFPLLLNVYTGSGAHLGSISPSLKQLGRKADHSALSSSEIMNKWIYTTTPHTFLLHVFIKHRDILYQYRKNPHFDRNIYLLRNVRHTGTRSLVLISQLFLIRYKCASSQPDVSTVHIISIMKK